MRLLLTLCIIISCMANTVNIPLNWNSEPCAICDSPTSNTYSCYDVENITFTDPIPSGSHITQVDIIIIGVLQCENYAATISAYIQNDLISASTFTACACTACTTEFYFTNTNIPNYNYGSQNTFGLEISEGIICADYGQISLTYDSQPTSQNECDCGEHATCNNNTCICDTNYAGPTCQCPIQSDDLSITDPPTLDISASGFYSQDSLTLVITNSVKYTNTEITFDQSSNCDTTIWHNLFDESNCTNIYVGELEWTPLSQTCLFTRTETPTEITYSASLHITNTEQLRYFTRTISSILPFRIIYPKIIALTSTISLPNSLTATIINSEFIQSNNSYIKVILATVVSKPLRVSPVNNNIEVAESGEDCDVSTCLQFWEIIITNITKCNLNGDYQINFDICADNTCTSEQVSFSINNNICSQIINEVTVSGQIDVFSDDALNNSTNIFNQNDQGYYLATIFSDEFIKSVTIQELYTDNQLLYDSNGNTELGNTIGLTVNDTYTGVSNQCFFKLSYTDIFSSEVTIQAKISIIFENAQYRRLLSENNQDVRISNTITLRDDDDWSSDWSSNWSDGGSDFWWDDGGSVWYYDYYYYDYFYYSGDITNSISPTDITCLAIFVSILML